MRNGLPENLLETSRELAARAKAAGDTTGVLSLYRKIVALNPELADFQNELGIALGSSGRLTEAAYRKAVELAPRKVYIRKRLALARGAPESRAQLLLSDCYTKLGETGKAALAAARGNALAGAR